MIWFALLSIGCTSNEQTPEVLATPKEEVALPDPATLPDVVLITLDTTRADRIGAYGYEKARTETLDQMAKDGRLYTAAYSPLPLTIPSHSSIFTGKYPPALGIRNNGEGILGDVEVTLAERLRDAGYETGASVAAFVTTRTWGFRQGFREFSDPIAVKDDFWHSDRPGSEVVDDILKWEEKVGTEKPRFAWVHLYDAHTPYTPTKEQLKLSEGRPYDAEVAMVDDLVQRVVDGFSARKTIFVVVGDHGEALGQHAEKAHGNMIYNTTQHVPFIIYGSSIEPKVIDESVSLVDVAPTILSLLNLPPLEKVHGVAVPSGEVRPIYMESWQLAQRFHLAPHVGVVLDHHKLIDTPIPELYDLSVDPEEANNIAADHPELVKKLSSAIERWNWPSPSAQGGPVDPEVARQLAALGYVDGGDVPETPRKELPDPKEHLPLLTAMANVEMLQHQGKVEQSLAYLKKMVKEYPEVLELKLRLAQIYNRRDENEAALDLILGAQKAAPDNPNLKAALAGQLAKNKRYMEAAQLFQEAADEVPYSPRLRVSAVAALRDGGEVKRAIELALSYLEERPEDYQVAGFLGVELVRLGAFTQAEVFLQRGAAAERPELNVLFNLAAIAKGKGDLDRSRDYLEKEVRNHPTNNIAVGSLIQVFVQERDWTSLVVLTERSLKYGLDHKSLRYYHAQALYNLQRYAEARDALDRAMKKHANYSELLMLDANLLKKEGHEERALARFAQANEAKRSELAQKRQGPPQR